MLILPIALAGTALATTPAAGQQTAQNIIPRLPPRRELEPRPPEELPSPEDLLLLAIANASPTAN